MKKYLFLLNILLSLVLLLTVGACAKSTPATTPATTPTTTPATTPATTPTKPTVVRFWYWIDNPPMGEFFRGMIDDFNKSQTKIFVAGEAQVSALAAREKLAIEKAAGTGPDATYMNTNFVFEFYRAGIVAPIQSRFDSWADKGDVFSKAVEINKWPFDDKPLLLMPWGGYAYMMFYNKDIYAKAGIQPGGKSLDEFIAGVRKVNNPPTTYGYLMRGDGIGFYFGMLNLMLAEGVVFTDGKGRSDLDSPAAINVATKIAQLYWDGIAQPTAIQDRYAQSLALMQTGKTAVYAAHTGSYASLRGANKEFESFMGLVPLPSGPAGQFAPTESVGICMLKTAKDPDAVWEFIKYTMQPDVMERFGKAVGMAPTRKSVSVLPFVQENAAFKMYIDLEPYYYLLPWWHKNWNTVVYDLSPVLWQKVLLKQMTVEDMLKQMADLMRVPN